MPISARNQLTGRITEILLGEVMAHVSVRVGKNTIESVITRRSAEQMGLKKGDTVTGVIESTEVMLMKGRELRSPGACLAPRRAVAFFPASCSASR